MTMNNFIFGTISHLFFIYKPIGIHLHTLCNSDREDNIIMSGQDRFCSLT